MLMLMLIYRRLLLSDCSVENFAKSFGGKQAWTFIIHHHFPHRNWHHCHNCDHQCSPVGRIVTDRCAVAETGVRLAIATIIVIIVVIIIVIIIIVTIIIIIAVNVIINDITIIIVVIKLLSVVATKSLFLPCSRSHHCIVLDAVHCTVLYCTAIIMHYPSLSMGQ